MEQRSTQRTLRAPAQHTQITTPDVYDEEYDDVWPPRLPSSTLRYRSDVTTNPGSLPADVQAASQQEHPPTRIPGKSAIPPRRTATQTSSEPVLRRSQPDRSRPDTEDFSSRRSGPLADTTNTAHMTLHRQHWLGYAGLALIVMLLGWVVLSVLTNWWTITQDDLHYGRPRTFQTDAVVGHDDSAALPSHFIALNLNRHIQVVEFPGGDSTKAKVYVGPILVGPGQDLSAVTLTFKDVNGDGKPDLIINVQGSHFVFINDNGQFRTLHPGENINTQL